MRSPSVLVICVSLTIELFSLQLFLAEAAVEQAVKARSTPQLDPTCSLPNPAVFVNPPNGTQNNSCWSEGQDQPCGSLPYAIQGAVQEGIPVVLSPGLYQLNGSCVCDEITHCNTWFHKEHGKCVCGDSAGGVVKCDTQTMSVELLSCHCMTYNSDTEETVVGACNYGCTIWGSYDNFTTSMPVDPLMICSMFNRSGQLCGECKEGYYQPAYSYETACVQCTYHSYNWVLYALAAFGPLTVFYIIILVFRINVASPPLTVYVQLCQMVTMPNMLRFIITIFYFHSRFSWIKWAVKLAVTIYSIWNLDFFRMLLPPICLSLNGLQLIAIDYAIACYPILLVIITYVLIELHDRNVRVVVWFLKPLRACLTFFRLSQRDMRSSVISAFASFILLSYIKFLSVSFDLLLPTRVYDMNGSSHLCLFNLPTVKYFSPAHLPYALTAIAVLLVFIIIPLLLVLLYPFRWFQRLIGCCRLHSHALQTFMDAFQGHLKDGTNGTQDCRHFAAAYLFLRILWFFTHGFTKSMFIWPLSALLIIALGLIVVVLGPYKLAIYNKTDATLIFLIALWLISVLTLYCSKLQYPQARVFSAVLVFLLSIVPLMWALAAIIYWVSIKKYPHRLLGRIRAWWRACRDWYKNVRAVPVQFNGDSSNELPDQINNPSHYELIEMGKPEIEVC